MIPRSRRTVITQMSAAAGVALLPSPANTSVSRPRDPLTDLGAGEAVARMVRGEMRAEYYTAALLDQAERLSFLNAFRTLDRPAILEVARAADVRRDAGLPLGRLHGLPIPVKDSVNTSMLPTSNGTASLRNFHPAQDAAIVRRLRADGGLIMGKTNLHELSFGWTSANATYGAVRNAYDPTRSPGGSSGGSASAVAGRMAPLAVAEDTWASIRLPAAFSGLAGLRPTWGRYPDDGIMPLTTMFDQVGPLARSVRDLVLFDTVAAVETGLMPQAWPGEARIGVPVGSLWDGLDTGVERVARRALDRLRIAGHDVFDIVPPPVLARAPEIAAGVISYQARDSITAFLRANQIPVSFEAVMAAAGPNVRELLETMALPPNRPSDTAFAETMKSLTRLRGEVRELYDRDGLDALVFPVAMGPPPPLGEEDAVTIEGRRVPLSTALARNTALGSCLGAPSLVLPAGLDPSGLPVGLEFLALPGRDRYLLSLGLALEQPLGPIPAPSILER